jgi:hypothetical protein
VRTCNELAHKILANTAPSGHNVINTSLQLLQEDWNVLTTKIVETKVREWLLVILTTVYIFTRTVASVFCFLTENIR